MNQKLYNEYLINSFARSVRENICVLFFRTDLAPSSIRQILSRIDLALG